ncbi:MAG: hypothetical protein Q8941_06610 [Bacteroidota bacterium]|nr:hypothetical protein [Bacteroidota bacterium]
MLKRTTGRLLLGLLVITGLAGTLKNSSLSQKERKQAIGLIRSSKNEVLRSVHGLSRAQINYKASSKDLSIAELIINMASLEKKCSDDIKAIMSQPSDAENRLKITLTDDQLLVSNTSALWKTPIPANTKISLKDPAEALKKFITLRDHHIKYIRTSTEDLRNHVVSTPAGWIDCYQYFLLLADQSNYFIEKINRVKSLPGFPKK